MRPLPGRGGVCCPLAAGYTDGRGEPPFVLSVGHNFGKKFVPGLAMSRALVLGLAAAHVGMGFGCRKDAPSEEASLAASLPVALEIEPADSAVVRGREAWIRWRTHVPAQERVLWRRSGEKEFRAAAAAPLGDARHARVGPLEEGRRYEFLVESTVEGSVHRSATRTFTVRGGLVFEPAVVTQAVRRDYDQTVTLVLRNGTGEKIRVAARALVQFFDLPADVVGAGSADQPVEIAPGASIPLRLAVAAADAQRERYEIPIEAGGAYALVHLQVVQPRFELALRVVEEDALTLAKTIEVRNEGDLLGDLALRVTPPNDVEVRLEPGVAHAHLSPGEILRFTATPVLYLEFESLEAEIEALAAGRSVRFPVVFKAPSGIRLIGVRSATQERNSSSDSYCTNRPATCSNVPGATGNGPTEKSYEDDPYYQDAVQGMNIIKAASGQNGKPYGGKGPDSFDCSGLVSQGFKDGGLADPNYGSGSGGCHNMWNNLPPADPGQDPLGVVVFFDYEGDGVPDHCAIVSETAGGEVRGFWHSSGKGVNEGNVDQYAKKVDGKWKTYGSFIMGHRKWKRTPTPGQCSAEATCESAGGQ